MIKEKITETKRIQLPNGISIPAKQYIEEIVNPLLKEDQIVLQNWDTISKEQYIEEYVLGETLSKYNGDFKKMLVDTTFYDFEKENSEDKESIEKVETKEQTISIYDYLNNYRHNNKAVAVITNNQYAIQTSDGTYTHDTMSKNLANSIFPNTETNHFGQSINLGKYGIVIAAINDDMAIILPKEKLGQSQMEIFDDVLKQIDKFNKETNSKIKITAFSSENIKLQQDSYTDNIQGLREELKNFVSNNMDNVNEEIVGISSNQYQKIPDDNNIETEKETEITNKNGRVTLTSDYFNVNIDYMKETNEKMYFDIGESLIDLALDEVNSSGSFLDKYMQILIEDCKNEADINNLLRFLDDISQVGNKGKETAELLKQTTILSQNKILSRQVTTYKPDCQFIYDELYKQTIRLNDVYEKQRKGMKDDEVLASLLHEYNTIKTNLAVLEGEIDPKQYKQLNEMIDSRIEYIQQVLNFINNDIKSFGFTTNQFLLVFISVITIIFIFFLVNIIR